MNITLRQLCQRYQEQRRDAPEDYHTVRTHTMLKDILFGKAAPMLTGEEMDTHVARLLEEQEDDHVSRMV